MPPLHKNTASTSNQSPGNGKEPEKMNEGKLVPRPRPKAGRRPRGIPGATAKKERNFVPAEDPSQVMEPEISIAINFLANWLRKKNKVPQENVDLFKKEIRKEIIKRYNGHWDRQKPSTQGNGYRCIQNWESGRIDPILISAATAAGIERVVLTEVMPQVLYLWVDPGEVSYKIGSDFSSICVLYPLEICREETRKTSYIRTPQNFWAKKSTNGPVPLLSFISVPPVNLASFTAPQQILIIPPIINGLWRLGNFVQVEGAINRPYQHQMGTWFRWNEAKQQFISCDPHESSVWDLSKKLSCT